MTILREADWEALEERVRSVTKEVVPCDILKEPIIDHPNQSFDAIITTLCLEAIGDFETFKASMKRLAQVLKPTGHLFIAAMLGMSFYRVGDQVIKTQPLSEVQLKEAIAEAGLVIKRASLYTSCTDDPIESNESDFEHVSCILAMKMS